GWNRVPTKTEWPGSSPRSRSSSPTLLVGVTYAAWVVCTGSPVVPDKHGGRPIRVSDTNLIWFTTRLRFSRIAESDEVATAPVLRRRGRGAPLRPRRFTAAHGTAAAQPPDPRAGGRAWHPTLQPDEA